MIKKIFISTLVLIGLVISSSTVFAADETITHTDDINDIFSDYEENLTREDIDIEVVSAIKTGDEVELRLKLIDGGEIKKSLIPTILYWMTLQTSHHSYSATYTGIDWSELGEGFEDYDSEAIVESDLGTVDINSFSGEGENVLSIKFDLYSANERLISISEVLALESATDGNTFSDMYLVDELFIRNDEEYEAIAGKSFTLNASLEEGNPDDYEWLWVFDDSNIMIEGQTPTYTINKPDVYTGVVYAYDSDGNYGIDYFSVNVSKSSTGNGGGGNNQPGFELLVVIVAIAVAMLILKKKR
jgi:hypothetical protein